MNRTVNYDLCQYEADDKTSYLVNYNNDMLKIDTAIKGAKDAADGAQAKADTADGKADINANSISTLNTQINGANGLAADVSALEGSVNTINSLIGNGEPTTQDKTIIGAINELAAEIPSGSVDADDVSYDNQSSGLTATNVQDAIDEVVAAIPSIVSTEEKQTATLAAGATSATLTFTEQTIGATTLVLPFASEFGVVPTNITTTNSTVAMTFDALDHAITVGALVKN